MTDEKALTVVTHAITTQDYRNDIRELQNFVKRGMHDGHDFGVIPGTRNKTLYKDGAIKLAKKFGLVPEYELTKEVEDFDKSFCYYAYRCKLIHFTTGKFAGEAEGSCNNREKSFRNKDFYDAINNVKQRAMKRALVQAVKTATMASEIFYEGTDDYADDEPPHHAVTKLEDPERIKLMQQLYGIGKDRGFSADGVKKGAYHKYNVTSLTDLSNNQLHEYIQKFVETYRIVASGEKPQKFTQTVLNNSLDEKIDNITQDHIQGVTKKVVQDAVQEGEVVGAIPCYSCGKHVVEGSELEYFCSNECKEKYAENHYPKKKDPAQRGWKFK